MKIIKHGSKNYMNPNYKFKCDRCGCQFIARKDELGISGTDHNECILALACPDCEDLCFTSESSGRVLDDSGNE